jgi:hypothetical protein
MKDGGIHSSSNPGATGRSGEITIISPFITLASGVQIFTNSANTQRAGDISIGNPDGSSVITSDGFNLIQSSNSAGGPGGNIHIVAAGLVVADGAQIHTDSTGGNAGSITIDFPHGGLLQVEGGSMPGEITTNSTSAAAGMITINNPSAIILNGSDIEAQGPSRGAFVTINSPAVVQSTDRENTFIVTGVTQFSGEYVDIAGSVALSEPGFVDASKVLQGRCAARAAGGTSRLTTRLLGPYGAERPRPVSALSWPGPTVGLCGTAAGGE